MRDKPRFSDVVLRAGAVFIYAYGLTLSAQTPAELQRYAEHLSQGTVMAGAEQDLGHFTDACPILQPRNCYYERERILEICRPEDAVEIGSIPGRRFLMVRYDRTVHLRSRSDCATDEVLVLESASEGRAKPVWFDATNPDTTFIANVSVVSAEKHSFLVVSYCVRGTMGCWDSAYLREGQRWKRLGNDDTWAEVYRDLPPRYQVHKSAPIDFQELRWEQSIATRDDPNCCPSGKILLDLGIVNGQLSVTSYKFVVQGEELRKP